MVEGIDPAWHWKGIQHEPIDGCHIRSRKPRPNSRNYLFDCLPAVGYREQGKAMT
jgi:hypothetical protein